MKDLILHLPRSNQPMFMRLAEAIRQSIRDGRLQPGEKLPSSRELAARFNTHRQTVMTAMGELVAEGWIMNCERKHYEVNTTLPTTFLTTTSRLNISIDNPHPTLRITRPVLQAESNPQKMPVKLNLGGAPDVRMFPFAEFKTHLYDALTHVKNLDYGDCEGFAPLVRQIEIYLRRVRAVSGRKVIVTNGSQEAIFLLSQLLLSPKDCVAVEELAYPPALDAIRFSGAKLKAVAMTTGGIDIDHLEQVLKRHSVRMVYLTPQHQYPTTVTMSAENRLRLYELSCRYDFYILEDDYHHEFHYDHAPVSPMASFDPYGRVLYVSTFSKILFPSARIGFLAVSDELARQVAELKRISSRQNETLIQFALAEWMRSGGFERHLRRMRRLYEERRDNAVTTLQRIRQSYPRLNWQTPSGGMALWLNLGQDSDPVAAEALKRQVGVSPESRFRMDGKPGTHLRIGFAGVTTRELNISLQQIFPT